MGDESQPRHLSLVIATLVLIIVLVSCFMCIMLLQVSSRLPESHNDILKNYKDGFTSAYLPFLEGYSPSCNQLDPKSCSCRGFYSGVMPAIESYDTPPMCCGAFGIPP